VTGKCRRDGYQSQDRADYAARSMSTATWLFHWTRCGLGRCDHLWIRAVERREIRRYRWAQKNLMIARSVGTDDERAAGALCQTREPVPDGNLTDEDSQSQTVGIAADVEDRGWRGWRDLDVTDPHRD
jgi:hypothetical protein